MGGGGKPYLWGRWESSDFAQNGACAIATKQSRCSIERKLSNLDILGQEKNKKQGEEKIDFKFTVSVPCEEGMQKSSLRLGQAREKLLLPSLLHGGGDLGAIRSRCWVATMDWGG